MCQAIADGLNYYLRRSIRRSSPGSSRTSSRGITAFAFGRFILYQSFIYGKSGVRAADILSAVQEIHGDKVGAVAFPADLRAELAAMEQDRQSMTQHIGSNMWAIRRDKSASGSAAPCVHQSASAVLWPWAVV